MLLNRLPIPPLQENCFGECKKLALFMVIAEKEVKPQWHIFLDRENTLDIVSDGKLIRDYGFNVSAKPCINYCVSQLFSNGSLLCYCHSNIIYSCFFITSSTAHFCLCLFVDAGLNVFTFCSLKENKILIFCSVWIPFLFVFSL